MRPPVLKSKKVSFRNLVKEIEILKSKMKNSKEISLAVRVERWNHITGLIEITYSASFVCGNVVNSFNSLNPNNLIEQVKIYVSNIEVDIKDIEI